MPALVNSNVGSFVGTSEELRTTRWSSWSLKYFRNILRVSLPVKFPPPSHIMERNHSAQATVPARSHSSCCLAKPYHPSGRGREETFGPWRNVCEPHQVPGMAKWNPVSARSTKTATPPEGSGGLSYAWRALRHRNFRLYYGGQGISVIGTWMTRLATSWLVYRLTGSALLLGLVGFSGQIPTFLLAPFAGVWIDRLNRRHLLLVTQVLAMVQSLALAALTLTKHITVHEIILLSAFQGAINGFDMPARQASLVQRVDEKEDLGNAIALNSSMVNIARLVGPSLAGAVIAMSGEGYCFLADGLSYLAVIASLLAMRHVRSTGVKRHTGSMLAQLKEGWTYVSGFSPIRTILLQFAIVSLMGWPFTVLMPIFAGKDRKSVV